MKTPTPVIERDWMKVLKKIAEPEESEQRCRSLNPNRKCRSTKHPKS
jgi:hypothetical protein